MTQNDLMERLIEAFNRGREWTKANEIEAGKEDVIEDAYLSDYEIVGFIENLCNQ